MPLSVSELKLTDVAVPGFSVAWLLREFLGFVRNEPPRPAAGRAPHREPFSRLDLYVPALIAICFYLLAIYRLYTPNTQIFDEVHHARTAMEYVDGLNPHEWSHPPFSKLMMALSLKAWGGEFNPRDGVWTPNSHFSDRSAVGWRFASVLFGTLTLPALYALARVLFGNRAVAIAAAVLLALDGVFFVQSRVAMTNIFTVFFITVAATGVALFLQRQQARWLLLAGIGLGFAIASRWSSLYAWAITVFLLFAQWFFLATQPVPVPAPAVILAGGDEPPLPDAAAPPLGGLKLLGAALLCLVLVPFVVYFATYLPNLLQGPGTVAQKLFTANGPNGIGWVKTFTLQADMFNYHATLKASHPYDSPWWSWPLELRPVWYFYEGSKGRMSGIWAIGNVFIWWGSVPAFLALLYLGWRERSARLLLPCSLLAAYGLGQWLAWGVKARALNFMHYYFECIPFACIALAYLGWRLWISEADGPSARRLRRLFVAGYGAALVAWFLFYYPLLAAYPVSDQYYGLHLWLGRAWV
ncbi:MAG: phospholipid carrier-dependent glycosyltransferase [Cytophagales bacterium]|nr:phospholipid carrier-dependent glycosyltransferase [Armatimonadota bacterium]